jgi:N6-L-threonylcarbamoyladenine synthase
MDNINKNVTGLGLESSCDETSASVVINGEKILSNRIFSQIDIHRDYSGVVPEIASRAHLEVINSLIDFAMEEAGIDFSDLDYVAATNRPGLIGSLMIGLQSAKTISFTLGIPLIAVNHLEAHLYAPFLEGEKPQYPFMGLLVSGGNTVLYRVNGPGEMILIGKTVDDAVGEAYDKVSKYLGLGYPGGPVIEQMALKAVEKKQIFPKLMTDPGDTRFSYSGLKTAVINHIKNNPDSSISEIVYSFQESALELLMRRLFTAAREEEINRLVIAGGVAANSRLRELLHKNRKNDEKIIIPSPLLCADNAAMICGIAYQYYINGMFSPLSTDVHSRV